MMSEHKDIALQRLAGSDHLSLAVHRSVSGKEKAGVPVLQPDGDGVVVVVGIFVLDGGEHSKGSVSQLIGVAGLGVRDCQSLRGRFFLEGIVDLAVRLIVGRQYDLRVIDIERADQAADVVSVVVRGNHIVEF